MVCELLQRTGQRLGNERLEVLEEIERAEDADERAERHAVAGLEAHERMSRDPGLVGELLLAEIPIEPESAQPRAQLVEDRLVRKPGFKLHRVAY